MAYPVLMVFGNDLDTIYGGAWVIWQLKSAGSSAL